LTVAIEVIDVPVTAAILHTFANYLINPLKDIGVNWLHFAIRV